MNLIKIVDQDKAEQLKNLGFTYTTEKLNDKTIYVFPRSDGLLRLVQSNFSKKDYSFNNTLFV